MCEEPVIGFLVRYIALNMQINHGNTIYISSLKYTDIAFTLIWKWHTSTVLQNM